VPLPFLAHLPPAGADVALERVRQLLAASEECQGVVTGGAAGVDPWERFEVVYWFNPLDNRDGPLCLVGLQPAGPDVDAPFGYSEQQLAVLIRLRFRWSGNWDAAHRGPAIPLVFESGVADSPVNPVPVPRTLAAWDAAVIRALRAPAAAKLQITVDGRQLPLARTVQFGPRAFGVEADLAPDGSAVWYNADTVVTYQLMSDFRTGALWNLRGS
jgi:hypothetical protein